MTPNERALTALWGEVLALRMLSAEMLALFADQSEDRKKALDMLHEAVNVSLEVAILEGETTEARDLAKAQAQGALDMMFAAVKAQSKSP